MWFHLFGALLAFGAVWSQHVRQHLPVPEAARHPRIGPDPLLPRSRSPARGAVCSLRHVGAGVCVPGPGHRPVHQGPPQQALQLHAAVNRAGLRQMGQLDDGLRLPRGFVAVRVVHSAAHHALLADFLLRVQTRADRTAADTEGGAQPAASFFFFLYSVIFIVVLPRWWW